MSKNSSTTKRREKELASKRLGPLISKGSNAANRRVKQHNKNPSRKMLLLRIRRRMPLKTRSRGSCTEM